jgi:hypothetical protein
MFGLTIPYSVQSMTDLFNGGNSNRICQAKFHDGIHLIRSDVFVAAVEGGPFSAGCVEREYIRIVRMA